MVVHDNLFKKDFSIMSDRELLRFRKEQVENLFNGDKGSRDNVERETLIGIVDKEMEMRFKQKAERRSNFALLIAFISLFIAVISLLLPGIGQKTKFFQIDRYNFMLACYFTGFEQEGVPPWQYETQIYAENPNIVSKFKKEDQMKVFKNIALMKISNNMVNVGLDDPNNKEMAREVKEKIKYLAAEIMENMKKYDEKISSTKCVK